MAHALERTSPKGPGQTFVGTCTKCGITGLTFADMNDECQNSANITEDEALLLAISGDARTEADPHPTDAYAAWAVFKRLMREDADYAWSWHCNLAMPVMDAIGCTAEQANVAAAHLMSHLFEYDITTHPHYEYEKGVAQQYHEMRLAADRADDAA